MTNSNKIKNIQHEFHFKNSFWLATTGNSNADSSLADCESNTAFTFCD